MATYIYNNTSDVITLSDISITIPPSGMIDVNDYSNASEISTSSDILTYISNGKITINDGINNLSQSEAIKHITGSIISAMDRESGKLRVHQTSRQFGTYMFFTGSSDDPNNSKSIGSGDRFIIKHKVGDPLTVSQIFDFNTYMNETYIHEAYIMWKNANFDYVNVEFVSVAPTIEAGTNTNYKLYEGYLIVPTAGDGNINITNDITKLNGGLFQCKMDELGRKPKGFWDADGNMDIGKFENIRPNSTGEGEFNMFASEFKITKLANNVTLLGDGSMKLGSDDVDLIPHGLRMKITASTYTDTDIDDHDWSLALTLVLHRSRNIYE